MHIRKDRNAITAARLHQIRSSTNKAINTKSHKGNVIAHIGAILLDSGDIHPAHALVRNRIATIRVTIKAVMPNILDIRLFVFGVDICLSFFATIVIV